MQFKAGDIVEGKIVSVKDFGAFAEIGENQTGLIHISEVANSYVSNVADHLSVGDTVKVKIVGISDDGKISLSIKKALPPAERESNNGQRSSEQSRKFKSDQPRFGGQKREEPSSFEEMLVRFKASSDDRISDLKHKNPDIRRSRRGSNNN